MRLDRVHLGLTSSLRTSLATLLLLAILLNNSFGQSELDFSNQASLDFNTPQRFKPVVGLEMGGIFLSRTAPDSQDFVFDDLGNVLLNANQLQGQMGSGLDATFNLFNFFSDSNAVDVQMRYFQAADIFASERITANEVVPVFFNAVPATPAGIYDINLEGHIRSFEANLVARTPYRIRMLAGFRFFEADENFDVINVAASSPTFASGFRSRAENTMAGGQLGVEGTILSNRHSRLFGSFKWALLSNDIVGTSSAADSSGNPLQADAFDSVSSQLLDFQLGSSLSFSRWFSLYAGYQGLVASDMALGLEQSRNASIIASTGEVFLSDTQWHGFKITGMATW